MPIYGETKEYSGRKYKDVSEINGIQCLKLYQKWSGTQWKTLGTFICPFCGEKFDTYVDNIKRGTTRSCGCYHKMKVSQDKTDDISGKIYNYVEVIERAGSINNKAAWKCRCLKCGTEFTTTGDDLKRNNVKSCGCLRKEGKNNFKDRTGDIVNGIKFIEYTGANSIWLCQCHCGKPFKCDANNITSGHTTSCGCRTQSIGAEKCEKILREHFTENQIIKEDWFHDCRDKLPLPFDFHIKTDTMDYLIEYDGEQHYKQRSDGRFGGEDDFQKTQLHDTIKNQYCLENNIPLIRIPYYIPIDKITINDLLPDTSQYLIK